MGCRASVKKPSGRVQEEKSEFGAASIVSRYDNAVVHGINCGLGGVMVEEQTTH